VERRGRGDMMSGKEKLEPRMFQSKKGRGERNIRPVESRLDKKRYSVSQRGTNL
jgi:hypothetical protein